MKGVHSREVGCYISPQSFMIMFSYSLAYQLWGLLLNFNWLVFKFSVPMFQPLIVIYRRGNFVISLGCFIIIVPKVL